MGMHGFPVLASADPKARDTIRRVLIRDQADQAM